MELAKIFEICWLSREKGGGRGGMIVKDVVKSLATDYSNP